MQNLKTVADDGVIVKQVKTHYDLTNDELNHLTRFCTYSDANNWLTYLVIRNPANVVQSVTGYTLGDCHDAPITTDHTVKSAADLTCDERRYLQRLPTDTQAFVDFLVTSHGGRLLNVCGYTLKDSHCWTTHYLPTQDRTLLYRDHPGYKRLCAQFLALNEQELAVTEFGNPHAASVLGARMSALRTIITGFENYLDQVNVYINTFSSDITAIAAADSSAVYLVLERTAFIDATAHCHFDQRDIYFGHLTTSYNGQPATALPTPVTLQLQLHPTISNYPETATIIDRKHGNHTATFDRPTVLVTL